MRTTGRRLLFAVLKNRQEMISLQLELGADPLAVDGSGWSVAVHARAPDTDRRVMETMRGHLTGALLLDRIVKGSVWSK